MKTRHTPIILSAMFALLSPALIAQETDTAINRNVVVERDFQPVIQHAGKQNTPLRQIETRIEPVTLTFSEYAGDVTPAFTVSPLAASTIRFTHPHPNKGWLTVAGGYPCSYLDFGYGIKDKSGLKLDLFAHHDGQWGLKASSESTLGMQLTKSFTQTRLFFNVDGNHLFYTRYGRYYTGDRQLSVSRFSDLKGEDKQHAWTVNTHIGIASKDDNPVRYLAQAGYAVYALPDYAMEHMVRSRLWAGWFMDEHTAALNFTMQNAFIRPDAKTAIPDSLYNARHAFRIEPYYEYRTDNLRLHAGVNLDLNMGSGQMLTGMEQLSFAPSPHVDIEYRIIPSWLVVYGNALGHFGNGTLQSFMTDNLYRNPTQGITTHEVAAYTPVDATVGFKIKPTAGLLLDIYAGYARLNNSMTLVAPTLTQLQTVPGTYMDYVLEDHNRWKVGAEITYHYRDIIHILLGGNYYNWGKQVYDRAQWDARLRIDAYIDSKWSIYSDNQFVGSRRALLSDNTVAVLRPIIDLRIGARYAVNRWLSCYAQLNNYLHRFNDIHYGYQSQGINGEIGLSWKF